jgi:hypothetical protein
VLEHSGSKGLFVGLFEEREITETADKPDEAIERKPV